MLQAIRMWAAGCRRDPAHHPGAGLPDESASARRDTTGFLPGVALAMAFLGLFALSARAQTPGRVFVAARVLPAGPSRAALSEALAFAADSRLEVQQLAEIHRLIIPAAAVANREALRPRAVITIAFLRN